MTQTSLFTGELSRSIDRSAVNTWSGKVRGYGVPRMGSGTYQPSYLYPFDQGIASNLLHETRSSKVQLEAAKTFYRSEKQVLEVVAVWYGF